MLPASCVYLYYISKVANVATNVISNSRVNISYLGSDKYRSLILAGGQNWGRLLAICEAGNRDISISGLSWQWTLFSTCRVYTNLSDCLYFYPVQCSLQCSAGGWLVGNIKTLLAARPTDWVEWSDTASAYSWQNCRLPSYVYVFCITWGNKNSYFNISVFN